MTLFRTSNLYLHLIQRQQSIVSRVEETPRDQFSNPRAIIDGIVAQLKIEPLVLHEEKMEKHRKETKIDMSHDLMYGHSPSVEGVEFTADIPFEGEVSVFEYETSTITSLGCPGKLVGNKVRISNSYPLSSNPVDGTISENLKKDFQQQLDTLKKYVACSREQVIAYNNQLPQLVEQAVLARREKINQMESVEW